MHIIINSYSLVYTSLREWPIALEGIEQSQIQLESGMMEFVIKRQSGIEGSTNKNS